MDIVESFMATLVIFGVCILFLTIGIFIYQEFGVFGTTIAILAVVSFGAIWTYLHKNLGGD